MVLCMTGKNLTTKMRPCCSLYRTNLFQSKFTLRLGITPHWIPPCVTKSPQKSGFCHDFTITSVKSLPSHFHIGTVLYHKNCDLVSALSAALGRSKTENTPITDTNPIHDSVNMAQSKSPPMSLSVGPECRCSCSIETQIENMSSYLNDEVHKLAKILITRFQNAPQQYATLLHTEN